MSSLPGHDALKALCSCEACSQGLKDQCKLNQLASDHERVVVFLLEHSAWDVLEVGSYGYFVPCHKIVLCYWSSVIRDALYNTTQPVQRLSIEFEPSTHSRILWGMVVMWCYSGMIIQPAIMNPAAVGHQSTLESAWNAAVMLHMPELANHCMRLVFVKYTYAPSVWGGDTTRAEPDPWSCPVDVNGPRQLLKFNRNSMNHQKLFHFVEDFFLIRGPLNPRARAQASQETIESWEQALKDDAAFGQWIEFLGGLEHEIHGPILPTHFRQWHKYFLRVPRRDILDWARQYDAVMSSLQGEKLELKGHWRLLNTGDDTWTFSSEELA
ncbi:uncharacterized protein F4822DRAFT_434690 [Hypoxylon trugodes]|uniref:uncharacterized protein n=1 Tax=Hypoxylon trugodes TaxID=326681 RepID=UPI00218CCC61|nr:uncharacterized protein F4822DRAFT_434690 [Hypoxylon trugodes]KAI1383579.1 hypothetical protein F4822DRAFT_434690 [Hypoxylon trugodes]